MNSLFGPSAGSRSKATPQTLCQKCLKRDDYECKSTTQQRPYVSRPSRTQQLANPKLVPKLASDVPNELLRKKGVADEELARKEAERDRKRQSASDGFSDMERNRSRSSSFSSSSVSTISTNLSRSPSPRRSSVAQAAHPQNLRRERMSTSPQVRETYRTRHPDPDHGSRKRRRKSRSTSDSSPSDTYTRRRRRERSQEDNRSTRRRHSSVSPDVRGRDRSIPRMKSKRTRSRSKSRDRSRIARNRQSMTPPNRPLHQPVNGGESYPHADTYSGERRPGSNNDDGGRIDRNVQEDSNFGRQRPVTVPPRKERSLSPFSKRLALTQAMNLGSR